MNFFACLKITLLLAITFLILVSLPSFDDTLGFIYFMNIIPRAVTEEAFGFGILVAFYRLRESFAIEYI
jgi:NADH-ubiquinone oxidoreductase chain 4L